MTYTNNCTRPKKRLLKEINNFFIINSHKNPYIQYIYILYFLPHATLSSLCDKSKTGYMTISSKSNHLGFMDKFFFFSYHLPPLSSFELTTPSTVKHMALQEK